MHWCWATAKLGEKLGTTHPALHLTKFLSTRQNPLPKKLRKPTNNRLQRQPRKADDGVNSPDLTTQLQLQRLTVGMITTLNLMALLMTFHQSSGWTKE